MALDLSVDVLALGAAGQQLHQVDVVGERGRRVHAVSLRPHELHQGLEGRLVVIEEQHVLANVHQLRRQGKKSKLRCLKVSTNTASNSHYSLGIHQRFLCFSQGEQAANI